MPQPSFKRCRRYDDPGHAHGLTSSCFHRQPFLNRDRSRQWMIEAIDRARAFQRFHVWGYVVMPEHVRLLIWPTTRDYAMSAILMSIKQSVARRAVAWVKREAPAFLPHMDDVQPNGRRTDRFWRRGGGHDRNIVEPAAAWAQIDYYHANPVRRGLCQRPEDWAWSSAREFASPGAGPLRIDFESLPRTRQG